MDKNFENGNSKTPESIEKFDIDKIEQRRLMDSFNPEGHVGEKIKTIELSNGKKLEAGMSVSDLLEIAAIPKYEDLESIGNYLMKSQYYLEGQSLVKNPEGRLQNGRPFVEITIFGQGSERVSDKTIPEEERRNIKVIVKAIVYGEEGGDIHSVATSLDSKKVEFFIKDYLGRFSKTTGGSDKPAMVKGLE